MSKWIPLDNHPWTPKPEKWVDVLTTDGEEIHLGFLDRFEVWTCGETPMGEWQPTYWMPLPDLPQ